MPNSTMAGSVTGVTSPDVLSDVSVDPLIRGLKVKNTFLASNVLVALEEMVFQRVIKLNERRVSYDVAAYNFFDSNSSLESVYLDSTTRFVRQLAKVTGGFSSFLVGLDEGKLLSPSLPAAISANADDVDPVQKAFWSLIAEIVSGTNDFRTISLFSSLSAIAKIGVVKDVSASEFERDPMVAVRLLPDKLFSSSAYVNLMRHWGFMFSKVDSIFSLLNLNTNLSSLRNLHDKLIDYGRNLNVLTVEGPAGRDLIGSIFGGDDVLAAIVATLDDSLSSIRVKTDSKVSILDMLLLQASENADFASTNLGDYVINRLKMASHVSVFPYMYRGNPDNAREHYLNNPTSNVCFFEPYNYDTLKEERRDYYISDAIIALLRILHYQEAVELNEGGLSGRAPEYLIYALRALDPDINRDTRVSEAYKDMFYYYSILRDTYIYERIFDSTARSAISSHPYPGIAAVITSPITSDAQITGFTNINFFANLVYSAHYAAIDNLMTLMTSYLPGSLPDTSAGMDVKSALSSLVNTNNDVKWSSGSVKDFNRGISFLSSFEGSFPATINEFGKGADETIVVPTGIHLSSLKPGMARSNIGYSRDSSSALAADLGYILNFFGDSSDKGDLSFFVKRLYNSEEGKLITRLGSFFRAKDNLDPQHDDIFSRLVVNGSYYRRHYSAVSKDVTFGSDTTPKFINCGSTLQNLSSPSVFRFRLPHYLDEISFLKGELPIDIDHDFLLELDSVFSSSFDPANLSKKQIVMIMNENPDVYAQVTSLLRRSVRSTYSSGAKIISPLPSIPIHSIDIAEKMTNVRKRAFRVSPLPRSEEKITYYDQARLDDFSQFALWTCFYHKRGEALKARKEKFFAGDTLTRHTSGHKNDVSQFVLIPDYALIDASYLENPNLLTTVPEGGGKIESLTFMLNAAYGSDRIKTTFFTDRLQLSQPYEDPGLKAMTYATRRLLNDFGLPDIITPSQWARLISLHHLFDVNPVQDMKVPIGEATSSPRNMPDNWPWVSLNKRASIFIKQSDKFEEILRSHAIISRDRSVYDSLWCTYFQLETEGDSERFFSALNPVFKTRVLKPFSVAILTKSSFERFKLEVKEDAFWGNGAGSGDSYSKLTYEKLLARSPRPIVVTKLEEKELEETKPEEKQEKDLLIEIKVDSKDKEEKQQQGDSGSKPDVESKPAVDPAIQEKEEE